MTILISICIACALLIYFRRIFYGVRHLLGWSRTFVATDVDVFRGSGGENVHTHVYFTHPDRPGVLFRDFDSDVTSRVPLDKHEVVKMTISPSNWELLMAQGEQEDSRVTLPVVALSNAAFIWKYDWVKGGRGGMWGVSRGEHVKTAM